MRPASDPSSVHFVKRGEEPKCSSPLRGVEGTRVTYTFI